MYLFLCKKNEGDNADYPLTVLIQYYLDKFGKYDTLIISPGYLSLSSNTIDSFCSSFFSNKPNNKIILKTGINGNRKVKNSSKIIINYYKNKILSSGIKKTNLYIRKCKIDHSKTILFYENKLSIKDFINEKSKKPETSLKAMVIGSSNFSWQTYYCSPADKGETDVLIIFDKSIKEEDLIKIKDKASKKSESQIGLFKELYDDHFDIKKVLQRVFKDLNTN